MHVEVTLTPAELDRVSLDGKTVVVIDVLRATTSIVTALENGAAGVLAVAEVDKAREIAATWPAAGSALPPAAQQARPLLAGERGARPPAGFDLGNSPLAFTPHAVAGRAIILSTTNGTRTLEGTLGATQVIVACLRNAPAAVDACCRRGGDVVIACAGTEGRVSLEDAACAAWMAEALQVRAKADFGDGARLVTGWFGGWRERVEKEGWQELLGNTRHGRRLIDMGFGADVNFCAEFGCSGVVPEMRDGWLVGGVPIPVPKHELRFSQDRFH